MDTLLELLDFTLGFGWILAWFAIWAICILIENSFIKKKKNKLKWIFPVVVLILSITIAIPNSHTTESHNSQDILQFFSPDNAYEQYARIYVLTDYDRNPIAFSQFILNDGENSKYLDFEIENGEITRSKEVLKYENEIKKEIKGHSYTSPLQGKSVTYGKLLEIEKTTTTEKTYVTSENVFTFCLIALPLPIILFGMCIKAEVSYRKKKRLESTRIKDL